MTEHGPTWDQFLALDRLPEVIGASANQLAKGAKLVAGSVDDTQKAVGQYTDKLCASLDAFRDSMDANSRATGKLTKWLIALTAVSAFAAVVQALGWKLFR